MKIVAAENLLRANDKLAAGNRQRLHAAGVFTINVVGSPGAGKTTLLEALFARLRAQLRPAVIEGDLAGSIDAERLERLGVPVVQINTAGACHLDASMIATALEQLDLGQVDLLVIENVGNLVCTAGFDLGEDLRLVVLSTSEGDDKAVKYPAIFQSAAALVLAKMDLLPHTNFQPARIAADYCRLRPEGQVFETAALEGRGIERLAEWLLARRAQAAGS